MSPGAKHSFIPYSHQWVDEADITAVAEVLRSDWITQGQKVDEFERKVAGYCGAKHAVAVSSGTAALHIACIVAGVSAGEEAIRSVRSLVWPLTCLYFRGVLC